MKTQRKRCGTFQAKMVTQKKWTHENLSHNSTATLLIAPKIWIVTTYHWTNFWFRSLRSSFGWGHLLFAYFAWNYDFQMLVILRLCIFSCIFESEKTRCQLQNSHNPKIHREIAPQPNAYFGDLYYRKIFLPTGRSFNQVERSCSGLPKSFIKWYAAKF